jgi:hypothetical protein
MRAFARIRITASDKAAVLSKLKALPEIVGTAPFQEDRVYGLYIEGPESKLSGFGERLSAFEGIILEYYTIEPEPSNRFEGTAIDRTITQFEQVASALSQSDFNSRLRAGRMRPVKLRKTVKDLKELKFDWVADKLESQWLIWYIFADLPEQHRKLAMATGSIFRNLSAVYHSPFISSALLDIGSRFNDLAKATGKDFPTGFDTQAKNLRSLVDSRTIYVEAAEQGGFRNAFIQEIRAGRG